MSELKEKKVEINKSVLIENCCKQIDEKISALKLERLMEWEKNHNFDSSSIDQKLEQLKEEKEQLCALFNNISKETIEFDIERLLQAS